MLLEIPQRKDPDGEQANRRREHPASAEAIRHPAANRDKHRQVQCVARQHGLHAERGDGERLGDGRESRV